MAEAQIVKIPDHVDGMSFRSVLAAYTTAYRQHGRQPTVHEVWEYWPRITEASTAEMVALPEFGQALAGRGIEPGLRGLSHQQHLVLLAMSDTLDKRSTKAKLDAVGVTTKEWTAWLRNPVFTAARRAQAARFFEDSVPDIQAKMAQQASDGSFQHQQFVMETMGEGPKAREQASARELVMAMVAAVQRATVGHPEIRETIMLELQSSLAATRMAQVEGSR